MLVAHFFPRAATHWFSVLTHTRAIIVGRMKTVMITGASAGLGKESAFQLAAQGWRVVMACRDLEKAEIARLEVEARRTNPREEAAAGEVNVWPVCLELSSAASIRSFADSVKTKGLVVDVLMHNAAVMPGHLSAVEFCSTAGKGKVELSFAVNHLGPFLLTHLLESSIAAPGGRIVCVSSALYKRGLRYDDLDWQQRTAQFSGMGVYGVSKFANLMWAFALHKRYEGRGITVVALHPGVVRSELGRNFSLWKRALMVPISYLVFSPVAVGAKAQVYCATAEDIEGGAYYGKTKDPARPFAPDEVLPPALDLQAQERLWQESELLAGLHSS